MKASVVTALLYTGACKIIFYSEDNLGSAVADPGFPWGGGTNSPGGCQHTILPKFPKNCMKLKNLDPPGGVHPLCPP